MLAVDNLLQLVNHCAARVLLEPFQASGLLRQRQPYADLAEVQGQLTAKRALLVAASGEHNLLLVGPPAPARRCWPAACPGYCRNWTNRLQVAAIHSVASAQPLQAWPQRPFRQPHHSASGPALVGGGSRPRPGEITLAHQGVLFLDELPEFDRKVLEVLREPLESGEIVIARAQDKIRFPARFQLVAAMNPCPAATWATLRAAAAAVAIRCSVIAASCPGRCSTASTCMSAWPASKPPCSRARPHRAAPSWPRRSPRPGNASCNARAVAMHASIWPACNAIASLSQATVSGWNRLASALA